MVICLGRGANNMDIYAMVQLLLLPPHHLCFRKIQNGLTFCYRTTRVVLEKKAVK